MTLLATIGDSADAFGHPTECTEPAPGSVQSTSTNSVTVTNGSQVTKELATVAAADIHFDSHAHDHTSEEGCHQNEPHDIDPDVLSSSITVNGSPVYIEGSGVGGDPTTGGDVDLSVDTNSSVSE